MATNEPLPPPILKRCIPTKDPKQKRTVAFRCEFAGKDACTGDVARLTESSWGHEPRKNRSSNEVLVCDAHRRCITCELAVEDHLFAVIGCAGVACNRPPTSAKDVDEACCFYCGGCKTNRPAAVKQLMYEDGDGGFRCEECAPTCPECGMPSDEELVTLNNGEPACQTCADEEAMDDMRDEDLDTEDSADGVPDEDLGAED